MRIHILAIYEQDVLFPARYDQAPISHESEIACLQPSFLRDRFVRGTWIVIISASHIWTFDLNFPYSSLRQDVSTIITYSDLAIVYWHSKIDKRQCGRISGFLR
ncbi:hypothetical protein D1872_261730 [compost metagenome]